MRGIIKKIIVLILYWSGINALYSLFLKNSAYAVGYHSIAKRGAPEFSEFKKVTIEADVFESHLDYLIKNGHTFMTVSQLKDALTKGIRKPTAIFFDDGFKNNLTVAMPILKKYNIPMTIFVTTGYLSGEFHPSIGDNDSPSAEFILNWNDLEAIKKNGEEIGSHGLSHKNLTECLPSELMSELRESRAEILQRLKEAPTSLSYPRGRHNEDVVQAAKKAGYISAVTTVEGVNSLQYINSHPLELRRIAPKPYDNLRMFNVKLYSWNVIKSIERLWS